MQGQGKEEGSAGAKAVPRQRVPVQGHFRVRARPGNERAGKVQDRPMVQGQGLQKERARARDMTRPPNQGRAKVLTGSGKVQKRLKAGLELVKTNVRSQQGWPRPEHKPCRVR